MVFKTMNYSRKTLISDWHRKREAEPKDVSEGRDGRRRLHESTYRHFGTQMDDWRTTTQIAHSVKEQKVKDTVKSMVQADYFHSLVFDRKTGTSDTAGKSVLSSYQSTCNEDELITTYALDYIPPRVTSKQTMQAKDAMDRKLDFRRRQSQFTDVADHRRSGRNTWQDFNESQAIVQGVAKSLYRQINLSCP